MDVHGRAVKKRIVHWRDAGLLDADVADRLLRYEAERPAIFGSTLVVIGALSIGLGLSALVAANWDVLPIWCKLSAHALFNVVAAFWAASRVERDGGFTHGVDASLIVLSASTLAFIAHVGQSFNLQGDLFAPMAAWAALTTPFMLYLGRGPGARWAWTASLAGLAAGVVDKYGEALVDARLTGTVFALLIAAGCAAPAFLRKDRAAAWGAHVQGLALTALVVAVSTTQLIWRFESAAPDISRALLAELLRCLPVAVIGLTAAAFAVHGRAALRRPATYFIVLSPLYGAAPLLFGGAESAVVEAAAVCFYWLALAGAAFAAGRITVYKLAATAAALRLFGVFVESFAGLPATGGGLILAGLALMGLAWGLKRLLNGAASGGGPGKKPGDATP